MKVAHHLIKVQVAIFLLHLAPQGLSQSLKNLNSTWNVLLKTHVKPNGKVSYQGFEKDEAKLKSFIDGYKTLNPASWSDNKKKAAYINFYNALMIYNILRYAKSEKIAVSSSKFTKILVNDISVPGGNIWNGSYTATLAGKSVHLDDIEHGLIRGNAKSSIKAFKVKKLDPRIHAAVNCAAISCPKIREVAYTEQNIDSMLNQNMTNWISSPIHFKKVDSDTIRANSIVFWYYDDFDDYGLDVLKIKGGGEYLSRFIRKGSKDAAWKTKHLNENFNDRSQVTLKLSSAFDFYYNWKINDIRN